MLWFRIVLTVFPALVVGLGYLAVGAVSKPRLRSAGGPLVAVYDERAVSAGGVDILRGDDPMSRGIRELVLEPLLEADQKGRIVPGIAAVWNEGMALTLVFVDESSALEARDRLASLPEAQAAKLGIVELRVSRENDLVVELSRPSAGAAAELQAVLDEIELRPIHRVRVDLKVGGAAEYHRHFLDEAVEGGQVRRVWLESDSSYELLVAGGIEKFLEELWIYFGDGEETVERIAVMETADFIEEPWVSFSVAHDRYWEDGTAVSAADLLFTIQSMAVLPQGGHQVGSLGAEIQGVEVEDERTVRVVYRRPYSAGLASWVGVRVLPAHYLGEVAPGLWPAGAGQKIPSSSGVVFRDEEEGRFTLSIREDAEGSFPGGGRSIRFLPAPSRMEFVASRRMGEVDLVFPGQDQVSKLMEEEPGAGLVQGAAGEWDLVAFNLDRSLFADVEVRKALRLALDRRALVEEVLGGAGRPIASIFAEKSGMEAGSMVCPYDPETALEMLGRAGWEESAESGLLERAGRTFTFELVANREDPFRRRLAQEVAAAWQELGIEVKVVFLPWREVLNKKLRGRDFDVVLFGWTPDPGWDLEELLSSRAAPPRGSNFFGFSDERVDFLVGELKREYSGQRRTVLARELQQRLAEAAPMLFLVERYQSMVIYHSGKMEGRVWGRWQDYLKPVPEGGA